MADIFPPDKRRQIMSLIKGKYTKAELVCFRYLKRNEIYFQKHYVMKVAGSLDITSPRKKLAVFIDGSFWHGYRYRERLDRRTDYWIERIRQNMIRDLRHEVVLDENGWLFKRVWDHDIVRLRTRRQVLERIRDFLAFGKAESLDDF